MTNTHTSPSGSSSEQEQEREVISSTSHDMTDWGLDVHIALALEEATDLEAADVITDFSKYVDPDALNRLFQTPHQEDDHVTGIVEFAIEEYDVVVMSDGTVEILRR